MTTANLTAERARSLLSYDQDTGLLTWKQRPTGGLTGRSLQCARTWNTRYAGISAGTHGGVNFYIRVVIFGKKYLAHRIAWLIITGDWPKNEIDHINGCQSDNRICNLRQATSQDNRRNQRKSYINTSGVTGVSWDKINKKWMAHICVNGKLFNIGRFASIDDATHARKAADRKYGFDPLHGATSETRSVRPHHHIDTEA